MKVTELREKLEIIRDGPVDGYQNVDEEIDAYLQAFATFLEELELGEKDKRRGWASDSDIVYISGRNHGIDQTRTLIQEQVKELRKI